MPICNEDVPRVFAGLRATYESLARDRARSAFDFFVLSDTANADTRVAELDAWLELCRDVDGFGRVFYRWRQHRIKRKSGNIADFCRRWGSGYQYMVVLDADSVMSGDCLDRAGALMRSQPDAGIIQTRRAPSAATRCTRACSSSRRACTGRCSPPACISGSSANRTTGATTRSSASRRSCSIARSAGCRARGALSGEILSHDFVEAALMRRAGWGVWIAYDLPGSYEEMPPNLHRRAAARPALVPGQPDELAAVLLRGLHPAHRAVFMTGVMAYLSAPLWFLFLVLSTVLLAHAHAA